MTDKWTALAAAQQEMLAAEAASREAAALHSAAKARVRTAYEARRTLLREATEGEPSGRILASEAMGITVPRVYQLLGDYPKT